MTVDLRLLMEEMVSSFRVMYWAKNPSPYKIRLLQIFEQRLRLGRILRINGLSYGM
jgi:hypothetical protein